MLLIKNFLGYLNDSWAGTYSQQLARMGSCKTNFLCTLTDKHVLSKEMFWMKTKTVIWFSFHMICETFTRILQPYNIRVAYKPITTLWRLLTNVKDKDKPEDRQGAIYKIKCSDCKASCIGETGGNLSTRLTEHKQATRNSDINNHIAEHHLQMKHQIDWDSVTCLTYFTDCYQRLTLES